jgi:integrase
MRIKESFTLYKRRVPSGALVFYYRAYTPDGRRTCGYSTGQATKTAAREYCNRLLRDGKLLPVKGGIPTFEDFAKGWWDYESCPYLTKLKARKKVAQGTAVQGSYATRTFLIPAFGKQKIDTLTAYQIDTWLTALPKSGYANNTANLAFKFLNIMLGEAAKQGKIAANPCHGIRLLPENQKEIEILTPVEVKKLFPKDWRDVWGNEYFYILNKLAACTGMRISEVLGLRGEFLFEGYINVCAQYNRYGYTDTKNHKERNIPVPKAVENDLRYLKSKNGDGYLFSENGGKNPVSRRRVAFALNAALEKIGIGGAERKRRNLTFHGWRHFFNTTLLMANVSDNKVMSLTGHGSDQMRKRYTHFDTTKFAEVVEVQNTLIEDGGAGKGGGKKSAAPARKKRKG